MQGVQAGDAEEEQEGREGGVNRGHAARVNAAGHAAAAAALLTADMLSWRHRYQCDHAGRPQSKPLQPNLSPSKRRRRLPSIKVGCTAKLVVFQPIGERRVYIKWDYKHTGHDVASMQSVAESRLPKRVREWISARVAEGRDWKAVRNLLRLGEDELQRLERSEGALRSVPEALRIRRMDVYNELRRQLLGTARKANTRIDSLHKWAEEVIRENGVAELKFDIPCADGEDTWAAFFMTSWQIDMLRMHGQDSVHHHWSRNSGRIHVHQRRGRSTHQLLAQSPPPALARAISASAYHDRLLRHRGLCNQERLSTSCHPFHSLL
ncbi:hypothetical protein A4X03_0g8276 [Tilletia caries]|uniref:Uncharacterized protein n=1 Tax=Tilletia caries TaxID=13290 RepID=A0A8T8SJD7_9BASI|nr:hypothetical protein A4X03_0g8276 [Tilletia caries]